MPHATYKYRFEGLIAAWAGALAQTRLGRYAPFVLTLDPTGGVQEVRFEPDDADALLRELKRSGKPHLFFDPFEYPEYCYLAWCQIRQETMERLIGRSLDPASLEAAMGNDRVAAFPDTWSVMF